MDVDGHAYARPPIDGHPDIKDAPARFTEVVNVDKIFVSKIKGHPILYDHTHKDFGLVDDSQLAWESVIKEMIEDITKHTAEYPAKTVEPFLATYTLTIFKKRWRQLRQYFSAERIRRKGLPAGDVKGGFSLYDDMQFVANFITQKPDKRTRNQTLTATADGSRKKIRPSVESSDRVKIELVGEESVDGQREEFIPNDLKDSLPSQRQSDTINVDNSVEYTSESSMDYRVAEKERKALQRETLQLLQAKEKQELLAKLTENRQKKLREKNELEQENNNKIKLNKACATAVATIFSSAKTEEDRKNFAFQVMEIIDKD